MALSDLLRRGVDLTAVNSDGDTALYYAAATGHLGCITRLLSAGADPNQGDQNGYTPLMAAVHEGHAQCVTPLLKAGANPNAIDNLGRTPQNIAIKRQDSAVIGLLAGRRHYTDVAWAQPDCPVASLLEGAGLSSLVDVFAEQGFNTVTAIKEQFSTLPRRLEAQGVVLTVVQQQLLREKLGLVSAEVADLLEECQLEHYAELFHDLGFDDVKVIKQYVEDVLQQIEMMPEEQERLRRALGAEYEQIVVAAADTDARPERQEMQKSTQSLRNAMGDDKSGALSQTEHTLVSEPELVKLEPEPDGSNHGDVLQEIRLRDEEGMILGELEVEVAISKDDISAIEAHLTAKGDPDVKNDDGTPALGLAAIFGRMEIAALLVDAGASLDLPASETGDTALHWAAFNGRLQMVEYLLSKGASALATNKRGQTPQQWAEKRGHVEVAALLAASGSSGGPSSPSSPSLPLAPPPFTGSD